MNELAVIGQGATAEVFEWTNGDCLKLFKQGYEDSARQEFHVSQQIMRTPLRIAKPKQLIQYQDRIGIIYERISGNSFGFIIMNDPSKMKAWAEQFARLHAEIHQSPLPDLPSPEEQLNGYIAHCSLLSDMQKSKLLSFLSSRSDIKALCHFDFHPLNVLRSEEQDVVIDWNNGKIYHPLADVALTTVLLKVSGFPEQLALSFCKNYIDAYLQLSGYDPQSFLHFQIAAAIARLNEKKAHETEAIERIIQHNLQLLLM
ncbi:phosphotransferase family protein [Marinicrinis lubricantis]|uniref:Phosphotransferase family protein n=1 Tax=Marinicrinis lubricantis TaxID=2086470 RepID=A0ABW1ILI9_9BACL